MKLLILSFYYPPDLSAGSFRTQALVKALEEKMGDSLKMDLITTLPNRFISYETEAENLETKKGITIHRLKMPEPQRGISHQAKLFTSYAWQVSQIIKNQSYDLIYATSSKLFTATLGAYVSKRKKCPLYIDIRDIFVDTAKDVLPKKISKITIPIFSQIEKWTIRQGHKVNLVSPGFTPYFEKRYPNKPFQYYTNGVDPELLGFDFTKNKSSGLIQVLYAGTMGEGQGLDIIIPELAHMMENKVHFTVIGEGARKPLLEKKVNAFKLKNIEIKAPVKREVLFHEYAKADILFLHLNNHQAFHKVLPSKLFEYGATGKPVWAGVGGYAAKFTQENISNSAVFAPGDALEAKKVFVRLMLNDQKRDDFVNQFLRTNIMKRMAEELVEMI